VLLATREREHDVKPLGLEGNKPLKSSLGHVYIYITRYLYMSIVESRLKIASR
jgi:hypothetical protein